MGAKALIGASTPNTPLEAKRLALFLSGVRDVINDGGTTLGTAMDSIRKQQSANTELTMPIGLQKLFETMGADESVQNLIIGTAMDGCRGYQQKHGRPVPPEVLLYAFELGNNVEMAVKDPKRLFGNSGQHMNGVAMDSIFNNEAHNQLSMQPNRAVVSIVGAISEAIPVAGYLPTDIGSNEARLIIVNAEAGSDFGAYRVGDSLMGVDMGDNYLIPERIFRISSNGGTGLAIAIHRDLDPVDSELPDTGSPAVKIYGGRTIIYVNGQPCASDETTNSPSITNQIHGSINIGGTDYGITGTVNSALGTGIVNFTPALPANTLVHVESVINYEAGQEALMPLVGIKAEGFKLFATPDRSSVVMGIDSATQFNNEVGVDAIATATMNIRAQKQTERHRKVIEYSRRIAQSYVTPFDMDWTGQGLQKTLAVTIQDLASAFGLANQDMITRTNGVPLTTAYVGKAMLAILNSLPPDLFQKSTAPEHPNIRYAGLLFSKFYIYYDPKAVETATTSDILCVGTHTETARNPILLGDAVPSMMIPIATGVDMKQRQAWYSRCFTKVTPYRQSQIAFGIIRVTGMPVR